MDDVGPLGAPTGADSLAGPDRSGSCRLWKRWVADSGGRGGRLYPKLCRLRVAGSARGPGGRRADRCVGGAGGGPESSIHQSLSHTRAPRSLWSGDAIGSSSASGTSRSVADRFGRHGQPHGCPVSSAVPTTDGIVMGSRTARAYCARRDVGRHRSVVAHPPQAGTASGPDFPGTSEFPADAGAMSGRGSSHAGVRRY